MVLIDDPILDFFLIDTGGGGRRFLDRRPSEPLPPRSRVSRAIRLTPNNLFETSARALNVIGLLLVLALMVQDALWRAPLADGPPLI